MILDKVDDDDLVLQSIKQSSFIESETYGITADYHEWVKMLERYSQILDDYKSDEVVIPPEGIFTNFMLRPVAQLHTEMLEAKTIKLRSLDELYKTNCKYIYVILKLKLGTSYVARGVW